MSEPFKENLCLAANPPRMDIGTDFCLQREQAVVSVLLDLRGHVVGESIDRGCPGPR